MRIRIFISCLFLSVLSHGQTYFVTKVNNLPAGSDGNVNVAGKVYGINGLSNANDSTIKLGGLLTDSTAIHANSNQFSYNNGQFVINNSLGQYAPQDYLGYAPTYIYSGTADSAVNGIDLFGAGYKGVNIEAHSSIDFGSNPLGTGWGIKILGDAGQGGIGAEFRGEGGTGINLYGHSIYNNSPDIYIQPTHGYLKIDSLKSDNAADTIMTLENGIVKLRPVSTLPSGTGTVTSVATGNGLSGGTITTSGTLTLDTSVAASKTWVTSKLGEKGAGTVTSVSAGTGMSFTSITSSGAVNADTSTLATRAYVNGRAGTSTLTYAANTLKDSAVVTFNGTRTAVKDQGYVLLSTATASNSATIDFTIDTTVAWKELLFIGSGITTASDNVSYWIRTGYGATPTYNTGSADYGYGYRGAFNANNTTAAQIEIARNADQAVGGWFVMHITDPSANNIRKGITWQSGVFDSGTTSAEYDFSGSAAVIINNRPYSAIRFMISTGNVSTGNFSIWGLK